MSSGENSSKLKKEGMMKKKKKDGKTFLVKKTGRPLSRRAGVNTIT